MRRFGILTFITVAIASIGGHDMSAKVRYVAQDAAGDGSSWTTASGDLQAMIDDSESGDEIWIARGVYRPTRLITDKVATSKSFILKDGVALYGGFKGTEATLEERVLKPGGEAWDFANETILNGDDDVEDVWEREIASGTSYRYTWRHENSQVPGTASNCCHVLYQETIINNHTVIDGLTVTGGAANQHRAKTYGGGLYALGNVSVNACKFVGNLAYFRNEPLTDGINAYGGAVYLNGAKDASVTNCYFSKNYANSSYTTGRGGALFANNVRVEGCVFEDCVAEDGGGAVFQMGGTLSNCTFRDCYGSSGGALLTTGTVNNITVYTCRGLLGGGVYIDGSGVVNHAKIYNCYADAPEFGDQLGGVGGGMYLMDGMAVGCVVYNNFAFRGGGIIVRGGKVVSCTVQNNASRNTAKGVANYTVWDPENMTGEYFFNTIAAENLAGDNFVDPTSFTGPAQNAEEFSQLEAADWALADGSPLIDTGTVTPEVSQPTDFNGNPRVSGNEIDPGAYEYQDAISVPAAVLMFDGSKEEVVIGFRVSTGSITLKVGDSEYPLEVNGNDKQVSLPLGGNRSVEVFTDGLQRLNINNQGLTAIDVSNAPDLTLMQLYNNPLTELDITRNPLLTGIYTDGCPIRSIDLSANAAMRVVQMPDNKLEGELDLSALARLSSVKVEGNNLSALILPKNAPLVDLACEGNKITEIDLENLSALRSLNISDNELVQLSLKGCSALEDLYASGNHIVNMYNLEDCRALETLNVSYNELRTIDLPVNSTITGLYLQHNHLQSLDLASCRSLSWINVAGNEIPELDIAHLTNLRLLHASDNRISAIDLSSAPYCTQVTLANNRLSSIDVSNLTSLYWLKVDGNSLSELNLSANTYLSLLECGGNQLDALSLSACRNIRRVAAEGNKLATLDVTGLGELCGVDLAYNNMTSAAIDNLISQLPDVTGQEPLEGSEWISILNISEMAGTEEADITPALAKGWIVINEYTPGFADAIITTPEVMKEVYFNLEGIRLGERPSKGMYVVRRTLSDGTTVTVKEIQ